MASEGKNPEEQDPSAPPEGEVGPDQLAKFVSSWLYKSNDHASNFCTV